MRSAVFGLLTGLLCSGCFEPPGEPCETAADSRSRIELRHD